MDLKLKRRLVGGAVLVLLAVIFVPMLFEEALRYEPAFENHFPEPPLPGESPPRSVLPEVPTVPLPSAWAVQVGSFSLQEHAGDLEKKLRDAGFPAFVDPRKSSDGVLYRVRVGPLLDKSEAEALAVRIKNRLGLDGFVVSHPE